MTVKDRTQLIEKQYGKSMLEILKDLAAEGHTKTSAAKALGYTRIHFTRDLCPRFDPDKEVEWSDPYEASREAQNRRWGAQPLSTLPLTDLYQMVEMRDEDPPIPYYVIGHALGYQAGSVRRWVELYHKHGEAAFTVPREELEDV